MFVIYYMRTNVLSCLESDSSNKELRRVHFEGNDNIGLTHIAIMANPQLNKRTVYFQIQVIQLTLINGQVKAQRILTLNY